MITVSPSPPPAPTTGAIILDGAYSGPLPQRSDDSPFTDWVRAIGQRGPSGVA